MIKSNLLTQQAKSVSNKADIKSNLEKMFGFLGLVLRLLELDHTPRTGLCLVASIHILVHIKLLFFLF